MIFPLSHKSCLIVSWILIPVMSLLIIFSNISLAYIIGIYIVMMIYLDQNYQSRNNIQIPKGIPIAKVIWTQDWEDLSNILISKFPIHYYPRELHLRTQIINRANSWDEIYVRYMNTRLETLIYYDTAQSVIGKLIL